MPQEVQDVFDRNEAAGTWKSKEVGIAMQEFFRRHYCTVLPPEDMLTSHMMMEEDKTVPNAV